MNRCALVALLLSSVLSALADQPAVTVYNQNFGVVRERIALDLKGGINDVRTTEITAHLEPDSVILRDPNGFHALQILEQNYRADPLSQELLLSLFEGQTIDFLVYPQEPGGKERTVRGRIIRSGYVPHRAAWDRYGSQYNMTQSGYMSDGAGQPIIEINGQLRFALPGTPLFPSLGDDTILKPTLYWRLETDAPGKFEAELSYVTGGMSWQADYNAIAPETGDTLDLIGWVTVDNQSGRDFNDARLKLMAGDVSKLRPGADQLKGSMAESAPMGRGMPPPVQEKAFDEFHLYSVEKPTTLHDRETKQIEFVRATGATARRIYVYDGARIDWNRWGGYDAVALRTQPEYGTQCNRKVWVMRELKNSTANHLGLPLPKGRMRFYRQDTADRRLEFVGENLIDHTPKDELLRIYTGNAFDLTGERRRTNYKMDAGEEWFDETFELKVRNHKREPVEVRIVEHLYRWTNWEIREKSMDFLKTDAQTIEFRVTIPPDGEQVVTYLVHYSW